MFNKRWGCRLKELQNAKKFRKPNPVRDAAGLSSLVGFLNQTAGVVAPKQLLAIEPHKPAPIVEPTQQPPAASQAPAAVPVSDLKRIFLTGRFKVGKDYAAIQAGAKIFSFSEPLHFLTGYFFGTENKDVPGVREFMQRVGQWGKGLVNIEYPVTTERAGFIQMIRAISDAFPKSLMVSWKLFGSDPDIWMQALLLRVEAYREANPKALIAVTGVRFQNEHQRLTAEGFTGFHVVASPATWAARLKQSGLTPESLAAKDISEHLAASLDASVTKTLSQQRQGNKLRAIWSDSNVPPPSSRLLTVPEFCAMFPKI